MKKNEKREKSCFMLYADSPFQKAKMKGIDMLCASEASTSICFPMDPSSSSSSSGLVGGRAIDRHNPIIRDGRRLRSALPSPPCSSQHPPINPKPKPKSKKKAPSIDEKKKKKSVAEEVVSPPGSTRYLLGGGDGLSEYEATESTEQVVVLRVSLHCKGCEGKLRKHLTTMKGVTSFTIDFAAKKVTVRGRVTPLTLLASVSKVKTAQFWAPPKLQETAYFQK